MNDQQTLYVTLATNAASYRASMRQGSRSTDEFGDSLDDASGKSKKLSDEVNKLSGRIRLIVDALALVGPAAIPITAVAIPAVTGLAAQAIIAGTALGVTALAFVGLGDAVKAIREAELEPSIENLEEMHKTLTDLSPAARDFALNLSDSLDVLKTARDASSEGFFPGAERGLERLEDALPRINDFLFTYADVTGDLAGRLGGDLGSEGMADFLDFLEGEARIGLTTLYKTIANVVAGLGDMWQAFDPVNDDFAQWLFEQSRDFKLWAREIEDSDGLESLFDYIDQNGPQVAETMGAIGGMALDLVQALAPLGGPSLQGLEVLADLIGAISDSPLGTPIMAGFAAVTLLNRGLSITGGLLTKIGIQGSGTGKYAPFRGLIDQSGKARTATSLLRADLAMMRAEYPKLNAAAAVGLSGMSKTTAAAQRTRAAIGQTVKTAGAAGVAVGAISLLATGAAEDVGITNTATLGLAGSMAGPVGAAVGTTIGAFLDLRAESNDLSAAIRGIDDAINDADFGKMESSLARLRKDFADNQEGITGFGDYFDEFSKELVAAGRGEWTYGDMIERELEEAEAKTLQFERAVTLVGLALDENFGKDDLGRSVIPSLEEMEGVTRSAETAMYALGYTWERLAEMDPEGQREAADEIARWIVKADSAEGRTGAFARSVEDLGNEALSTADSAKQMSDALDALLGPTLEAEAATDAWRMSIKDLRKELHAGAGFAGFGKEAMENREITRAYVEDSKTRLTALAGLTETTEKDMAAAVAQTRREFIEAGIAAGISRKAITRRADAMGLTPKLVRTVFEAAGITETEIKARNLANLYERLPKKLQTNIATNGIPKAKGDIDKLVEKYNLTDKQRTALVTIRDMASKDIEDVIALLEKTDGQKPNPDVSANTAPARSALSSLLEFLGKVDGTTATTTVYTRHATVGGPKPGPGPEMIPERPPGIDPKTPPQPPSPRATSDYVVPSTRAGSGGTTTVQEAPLIGTLTVPAERGASYEDVDRTIAGVVRATSLARRSGRWQKRRS